MLLLVFSAILIYFFVGEGKKLTWAEMLHETWGKFEGTERANCTLAFGKFENKMTQSDSYALPTDTN